MAEFTNFIYSEIFFSEHFFFLLVFEVCSNENFVIRMLQVNEIFVVLSV